MIKTEKAFFIDNLRAELIGVKAAYLVNYAGLSVSQQRELKKRLKEVDARFTVVKNTLLGRAGKEAKVDENFLEDSVLSGQNALVFADSDPLKPLSVIVNFAKEFVSESGSPLPQIKVGLVEGYFQDKDKLINLANLGGKDAIVAQLIGMLMAPTYQTVAILEGNLQSLIYILDQKSKK